MGSIECNSLQDEEAGWLRVAIGESRLWALLKGKDVIMFVDMKGKDGAGEALSWTSSRKCPALSQEGYHMAACSMVAPCSEEEAGHGAPLPEPCHQDWSPSSNLWPCNCGVLQHL